jgi:IMP dehydrogenase
MLGVGLLKKCKEIANLLKLPNAGMTESHVHDVMITKEAPNYQRS